MNNLYSRASEINVSIEIEMIEFNVKSTLKTKIDKRNIILSIIFDKIMITLNLKNYALKNYLSEAYKKDKDYNYLYNNKVLLNKIKDQFIKEVI